MLPPSGLFTQLIDIVRETNLEALNGQWLDAGCGTGRHACHLADILGAKVLGVDYDVETLEIAQKNTPGKLFDSELITYERASLADLPYPDGHFSGVCCNEVLHMMPRPEQQTVIASLQRVTKSGGVHVVSGYVADNQSANGSILRPGELRRFYDLAGWTVIKAVDTKPQTDIFNGRRLQRSLAGVVALRP